MKRLILSNPPDSGGIIRLCGEDYHYLVRVKRLKPGMLFNALLPCGKEAKINILSTTDNVLVGENLNQENHPDIIGNSYNLPQIEIFQGLAKANKMDLIIRQAAECGIMAVVPFESEYSAVRSGINSDKNGNKLQRWKKIVREGRQQSASLTETEVRNPCSFKALLEYWESLKNEYHKPLGILLHQDNLSEGTPQRLEKNSFHGYLEDNPDFIALAVGPEGGFSPREAEMFLEAGFKALKMGNNVLRCETAALYACAAAQTILLERETWSPRIKE